MTEPDAINPDLDCVIDQIVDGALTPAELRAAVDRLEREPDGWKRCALAFLEAQVLNESCGALGQAGKYDLYGQSVPFHPPAARRPGHR